MNTVQIIGNITADPELKTTANGVMMTEFTVAVSRRRNEDGADFVRCKAFGKTAEVITQYVRKGNKVGIVGHIEVSQYQDQQGNNRSSTKVVAEHVDFLERKDTNSPAQQTAPHTYPTPELETIDTIDESLPF